jgi:hypothetical protein
METIPRKPSVLARNAGQSSGRAAAFSGRMPVLKINLKFIIYVKQYLEAVVTQPALKEDPAFPVRKYRF